MSLFKWVSGFQEVHTRARRRLLTPQEMTDYLGQRNELARMLLGAQQMIIGPGQQPRKALRVSRQLPVELALPTGPLKTRTLDVSSGGFAVMLDQALETGLPVDTRLVLPRDGLVELKARTVASKPHGDKHRVAFIMPDLSDEDRDRVEFTVFDAVLEIMSS